MTPTQGEHAQPEALQDFEVRKLAAIGAVSTSSGLVERRPIEYRRELEDQFVRGFRAAEKRLAAHVVAQPAAPQGGAYAELPNAKTMAQRLMGWKLPADFAPDCYVSFDRERATASGSWPIGTNLFTVAQAEAMFAHVLGQDAVAVPAQPAEGAAGVGLTDERDEFEKVFPLPSGCIRVGNGYASTGYSNWEAHTHRERWRGWQARASHGQAAAGVVGCTAPKDDDQRAAAQFFADNPSAALLAFNKHMRMPQAAQPAPAGAAPVARIEGIDEYGPRIEWMKHWVDVGVGTQLYTTAQPAPAVAAQDELMRLAKVALSECHYAENEEPQDWIAAAMRVCRAVAATPTAQAAPAAAYSPLTLTEARDLTCMLAGAPWPDEMLPELQRLLTIYDGLRANNQRPVDPATLSRKVVKEVMRTGQLPTTAQPAAGAVAGWQMVPVSPDEWMEAAGDEQLRFGRNAGDVWDAMLSTAPTPPAQAANSVLEDAAQPRLKVRLTAFPESNGKQNWTALLVRAEPWDGLIGNCGGISLARGELWNRVAYEAECARFLIGDRDTEPFILDYGDDIKTPEEWKGEVRGGRKPRDAARKQGANHEQG